jgi:hypothetical protein
LGGCGEHTFGIANVQKRVAANDNIRLRNCNHVVFDHVKFHGAGRALRVQCDKNDPDEINADIPFRHCEVDGGAPPWLFRSDRKDTYYFRLFPAGPRRHRDRGGGQPRASTAAVLISGDERTRNVSLTHCEIVTAHDVYVFGEGMRFHHTGCTT